MNIAETSVTTPCTKNAETSIEFIKRLKRGITLQKTSDNMLDVTNKISRNLNGTQVYMSRSKQTIIILLYTFDTRIGVITTR